MNVIDVFERNFKNIPEGAEAYNFDIGCFTKKIGILEYYFADYANTWRLHSRNYNKDYSLQLDHILKQDIIDQCKLILSSKALKLYIINENSIYKYLNGIK